MTLAQLRALVAVAKAGSITVAAEQLGITQPALSRTISGLEHSLGVTLLVRHHGGTRLTAVAERLIGTAQDVLALTERIRRDAGEEQTLSGVTLRVGSLPTTSVWLIPRLLASFGRSFPGVEVRLFDGTSEQVLTWLREGVVDVGFVVTPCEGVKVTPLTSDELWAVVPASSPLATHRSVSLHDLQTLGFLHAKFGCEALIEQAHREAGVPMCARYSVRDFATLVNMIREGLGYTLLPEVALPDVPGVRAVKLHPGVSRSLGLGLSEAALVLPAARVFSEHTLRHVG
ncbi:LysR family transcriptional regulator [Deinococcus oregonensis]|uniref:LysR family transcriptional regulator n=1 Tax=Deinococcus oregonensis TaxID=1805970 RepID=A0ABV6AX92_9DEIO